MKLKAANQLTFKQYGTRAQSMHAIVKLLRREIPDCIMALNPWLLRFDSVY